MHTLKPYAPLLLLGISSFGVGLLTASGFQPSAPPFCLEKSYQELALVEFLKLEGDLLKTKTNGAVRLIWNDAFVEGQGLHTVALGQLPSQYDQPFREFAFVGNVKTKKFYPSNSYPGRGTDPLKRRFFNSKSEAEAQGFVASKLVK